MKTISLCMIVKDEENVIERCLKSVKGIFDEIIIVDTGSSDSTKKIVSKYTDKIYDYKWNNDFSEARNYSFSKATCDYIMWLDADDVLLEEDAKKLKQLIATMDGTVDVYMLKYNYWQDENGKPSLVQERERIFKKENNYKWISPIHEIIIPSGNIKKVDIYITHKKHKIQDPQRNLKIFKRMIDEGKKFDERLEYCYAKELYFLNNIDEAIKEYEKFISKYINEYERLKEYMYSAIIELSDCYKRKNLSDKELETLMLILKKQIPKQECLTRIGDVFLRSKKYELAVYWFKLAIDCKEEEVNKDYEKFLPYISLGVCYYWLNDIEKANEYNEKAGQEKPDDLTYIANKKIYNLHN